MSAKSFVSQSHTWLWHHWLKATASISAAGTESNAGCENALMVHLFIKWQMEQPTRKHHFCQGVMEMAAISFSYIHDMSLSLIVFLHAVASLLSAPWVLVPYPPMIIDSLYVTVTLVHNAMWPLLVQTEWMLRVLWNWNCECLHDDSWISKHHH